MKRIFLMLAIAVLSASCAQAPRTSSLADTPAPSATVDVKIIAFNDFHGNLRTPSLRVPVPDATQSTGIRFEPAGGIEQFSAMVQSLKAKNKNSVVVSAGDMVGATPLLSALFKDEPTIEAMNLVGIDFHAVGNHEFDYGVKHLKRLKHGGCKVDERTGQPDCEGRSAYAGANFTFLAANVIEEATGKPLFPAWGVKEFDGIKVAFIGLTLRGTSALVRAGGIGGIGFRDEVETVNALVPQIRAQGIEAVMVVIHQGGTQTGGINGCNDFQGDIKAIIERFDNAIDVVLSGHTHQSYVCEISGKLVTSAGSYGTLLTEIDLSLDRATRDVVRRSARNQIVRPDGERDTRLTAMIDAYARLSAPLENRVVAKVSHELPMMGWNPVATQLGNLIADAQLHATAAPDKGAAVIAINNQTSVRVSIIPDADGSVTYGSLFKVQPFQNDLIVMTLTGSQLKRELEYQFTSARTLLDVSAGFSYTWDASRALGEKVLANSMRLNGVPIKPDLQYRVTVNRFLADGNEGHTVFNEGTERYVSVLDLDALVAYLREHSPYTPPPPGGRMIRNN